MWHRIRLDPRHKLNEDDLSDLGVITSVTFSLDPSIVDISCSEEILAFLILRYSVSTLRSPFSEYRRRASHN